uniref:Poly [ADP-ribose] polymerase n=1 Tax=Macrostomum lignano TaxID=282301 RepID=A0A1I8GGR9_9PLAT
PRRTVEAQYESLKNEIDSLKSSITVAEKTVTEKLILSVQAKKQQFDKEFLHCSNWISGKSESLPRIQLTISDSEDLSLIDQQVKCLADLCCEIDQWQSTVENVKATGQGSHGAVGPARCQASEPTECPGIGDVVSHPVRLFESRRGSKSGNGKQYFSQKYVTACRDFERRRRHICEWIEGTLSKIGDLSYQFEDRRLDAIENSMAEDGERWLNSALKAGTRIPARLQSTSGVEPHPEIQRQLEELMDHWDVLNSAVNQVRANAQAEQPSQQSDTAMSRKFLQCAHVPDRELRKKLQSGLSMHILSIEEIRNPVLDRRFNDVRSQLFDSNCQPKLLFHGTKEENAECIIRDGFRFGHRGKFGVGIYFATNLASSARHSEDAIKCLLVCEVLVGLKWTCNDINDEIDLSMVQGRGCDSVYSRLEFLNTAGGGADDEDKDEYVIYRTEQATPRYLVKLLLDT